MTLTRPYKIIVVHNQEVLFLYETANNPPHVGELIDLRSVSDVQPGVYKIDLISHKPRPDGSVYLYLKVKTHQEITLPTVGE